jgi:hypothetical protein
MGIQIERLRPAPLSVAWQLDLPAGVRQADCDGRPNDLAEADGNSLWHACDERQQEALSARFLQFSSERLRDALLDVQDGAGWVAASPEHETGASIGRMLWTLWISFRDRMLREMVRRGELSSI